MISFQLINLTQLGMLYKVNLSVSFAIIYSTDSMKPDRRRLYGESAAENTIVPFVLCNTQFNENCFATE